NAGEWFRLDSSHSFRHRCFMFAPVSTPKQPHALKARKAISYPSSLRNHTNNCVPVGRNLIGFDRKAHNRRLVKLRCMRDTGAIKWSEEGLGCGSVIQTEVGLLVLSDQGEMILADFGETGFKPFNRTQILDGKCWTHPILVDGMVYARNTKGRLVCYKLQQE
ncbi:MAG: outer membrane protein assembly factor BamB, partial [Candidatus Omnitrophota bacterium]